MKKTVLVSVLSAALTLSACATTPEVSAAGVAETAVESTSPLQPSPADAPVSDPYRIIEGIVFQPKVAVKKPVKINPEPELPKKAKAQPKKKRVKTPAPAAGRSELPSRLAGRPWGVYRGPADQAWNPYLNATGTARRLLSYIINKPKAQWFGSWIPENEIYGRTKEYISNSQAGNPRKLVQITVFRMDPWYQESKRRAPTAREVSEYKTWVDNQVRAIGDTPTAIILQPDLTFLRTVPNFKLSSGLISYAAQRYGSLPNSLVYLEAGAADWPAPGQGGAPEAARLLTAAGIKYTDGFATNTTHYSSTANDIKRIADLAKIFEARGLPGLKGVINTSSNGNPFDFGTYTGPDPDEAFVCKSKTDNRTCVTLGIPPTADVANPKWGMAPKTRALAREYVDAYLWIGRPWLYRQNSPFLMDKALQLVRSAPFR